MILTYFITHYVQLQFSIILNKNQLFLHGERQMHDLVWKRKLSFFDGVIKEFAKPVVVSISWDQDFVESDVQHFKL